MKTTFNVSKAIILFYLFGLVKDTKSQSICLDLDSIVVYSLPLNLKTKISLSPYEVRNFDNQWLQKTTLVEDSVVIGFLSCFVNQKELISTDSLSSIDSRIVFDLYSGGIFILTISVDSVGFYKYLDKVYSSNKWLLLFIERYVD